MKALNKLGIFVATCALTAMAGLGVARAGEVTVKYKTFPSGPTLDKNVISAGCDTATADDFPDYQFLFWDNQGKIEWSQNISICVGSGDTNATAWYVPTGGSGGGCPDTGCYITTFAFSTDHDEILAKGTPITMVSPNSPEVWVTGSSTVNTADGPESVSAFSSLAFPKHAAEPFRYWQQLGTSTETIPGIVYHATQNSTAWAIAFYGPDPCQTLEEELASCEEGVGPHGPLNCAPIGKELLACQKTNREVQ